MNLTGKTVLVTGAGGFIGSHLCEMLVTRGVNVKALCRYNSSSSWGWLESSEYAPQMNVVLGDVRDAGFCMNLVKDVDAVFNLAALIGIPYSYVAVESYIDTNVKGALNICQAARSSNCQRVLQMSTSEVYGSALYVPIDEKHPLQPQSPYSASKIGADSLALSMHNAFDLEVVLARPFNTYGPRQSARAVLPTIISQLAAGKKKLMLGSLDPLRDFNFVEDTCRGLIMLMECDEAVGQATNIGSGRAVSIGDAANLIKDLMGSDAVIMEDPARVRPANSEVSRLLANCEKAKALCGYEPQVSLEEGLSRTIEWFCNPENLKLYKEGIYNV